MKLSKTKENELFVNRLIRQGYFSCLIGQLPHKNMRTVKACGNVLAVEGIKVYFTSSTLE